MSHRARRTVDPDAMRTLRYLMAAILLAVCVVALGFVVATGDQWLQIVMAAVGGVSLGLVPWMATSEVNE
jgi:hypothetical protein